MIKTKSIYDAKEESDGTRILISRYYPRFIEKSHFDERMLVLSPDRDRLLKWKHSQKTEEDWKIFEEKFLAQMNDLAAMEAITELRRRSSSGETITLLCYCKKGEHCHRYIIRSLIEDGHK
ncbi:MAG TPA: DUF488 family protein [Nitrososphaeraceae archaeon]|jgi:uncharacterized protein YeaO (DUF488 family)